MIRVTLTACLFFITFNGKTLAQDLLKTAERNCSKRETRCYTIRSLYGKNAKVLVMPDYEKHVLRISCLKDTISINNYWGVPVQIKILNESFVEMNYAVRAGSNMSRTNTMLICVNENRLYDAMHILRSSTFEASYDHETYNLKISSSENNKKNFNLTVKLHEAVSSKFQPETNYNYNEQSVLHFDRRQKVFYSIKMVMYDSVYADDKKTKQQIRGDFPVIILGDENYYYIKNEWWQFDKSNFMYKFQ